MELCEKEQQLEKLYGLCVSGGLEDIDCHIEKFNIFNVLKLDNAEIRHSNFLAWLLDPLGSHEMGDYFLRNFLIIAIKDFAQDDRIGIKLKDIYNYNFQQCEIRREYKNIDLLLINRNSKILNPNSNFVCLIENKIWSGEHSEQLERYAEYVEKEFKNYKKLHIFLTPTPNPNEKAFQRGNAFYIQMNYEQIVAAIEKTLKCWSGKVSDDVRTFIEHYKKMVERDIMKKINNEVKDLCRTVYNRHKEAIDLIVECNNSAAVDMTNILREIVNENPALKLDEASTSTWTKFYPENIDGKDVYLQCCINNGVKLELVVMNNHKTEGLLNFLIKKLELGKPSNGNTSQGFTTKIIATLVPEHSYFDQICLSKEVSQIQLKKRFEKTDIVNKLSKALEEYKTCTPML